MSAEYKWELREYLVGQGIKATSFMKDFVKEYPQYTIDQVRRVIYYDVKRVNLQLMGDVSVYLGCSIDEFLRNGADEGKQSPTFDGDIMSLSTNHGYDTFFRARFTEKEEAAFEYLAAQHHTMEQMVYFPKSDVIKLLNEKTTDHSTYLVHMLKQLKVDRIPVRAEKASNRYHCFVNTNTQNEGYIDLVLMSGAAVKFAHIHSYYVLDLIQNFCTFRKKKEETPWFKIEDVQRFHRMEGSAVYNFKRQQITKSVADINKFFPFKIDVDFKVKNRVTTEVSYTVER